jgi:hypothetical protein
MIQVAKWSDCCAFFLRSYLSLIDSGHDDFVNIQRILDDLDDLLKKSEEIIENSVGFFFLYLGEKFLVAKLVIIFERYLIKM